MNERQKVIAFLRRWSDHHWQNSDDDFTEGEIGIELARLATAIEAGEHLKRPEPTVPASEWIPKPNLQQ